MTMKKLLLASVALTSAPAFAEEATLAPDTIIVTATRMTAMTAETRAEEDVSPAPDGAAFIARQPGMALIDNGTLSGQVQIRGLFGERILLRINGQHFATGGPNAMDPAMHYAPMALIDRVEIARGISPVRDGPGLGGGVNTDLKQARFGDGDQLTPQVDVMAQYASADDSVAVGGLAGFANDRARVGVIASYEKGDDLRFPGGRIGSTSYQRTVYGIHGGFRAGPGELSVEYRRQETGKSGNPPFAMDIIYFHTDFARIGFEGDLSDTVRLETHANYAGVKHRMNNFTLRPVASVAASRQSDTYADTMGADASVRLGSVDHHIQAGADVEVIDKGYMLYNPANTAFFIHPLDHARQDRVGGFVEGRTTMGEVQTEVGLRVDRHRASTGVPRTGPGVPAGPTGLAVAFASADRQWSGTSVDAALRLWSEMGDITPRLTLAHKTRAPSLVERYSWLPTEASGGLADGNIYVGAPQMKIEKAWLAELGFDWSSNGTYARPVLYYRRIDDFIQGVPFDTTPGVLNTPVEMVSAASGDPTPLRFANVDATIYGADIAFGAALAGPFRMDGVATYVRGKRRDVVDNLYRMTPPNARLSFAYDTDRWSLAVEAHAVARQSRTSATNGELGSSGYVLANLYAHWVITNGLRLDAGLENAFNRHYVEHLAGYNRITGSDVAVGARLPGAGRSAFVRLRWTI